MGNRPQPLKIEHLPEACEYRRKTMVQVESEAIAEIDYDADTSRMFVRFAEGIWYTYFTVPRRVHEAFLAAPSHGRFFHDHIRDKYPFRKGR
ncbi:MAG: KTSC domain-containing protein [Sphingomicrobium sp.]